MWVSARYRDRFEFCGVREKMLLETQRDFLIFFWWENYCTVAYLYSHPGMHIEQTSMII